MVIKQETTIERLNNMNNIIILPKNLEINVTQYHIDTGIQKACGACPIALAVRELGYKVSVDGMNIHLYDEQWKVIADYKPSPEARVFISNFDNGKPVKPFKFTAEQQWTNY